VDDLSIDALPDVPTSISPMPVLGGDALSFVTLKYAQVFPPLLMQH
jgi:hypothetical protein